MTGGRGEQGVRKGSAFERFRNWKVPHLESSALGRFRSWKVSQLEGLAIGKFRN
jgi:hypothetical protein